MMDSDCDIFSAALTLAQSAPSSRLSGRWKKHLLHDSLNHTLDRVNVLGDGDSGHTGCVNALSWANNGELLLSGGDDTTVRVWRLDMSNATAEYPFVCDAVIRTGHRGNIFNAQMLPYSSRIVTVAGDHQVRICDVGDLNGLSGDGRETIYTARQANVRVLKCHKSSVKRITTENSPDLFLTVSEDGTVRQHDLRVPHDCSSSSCPAPLVRLNHSLSALSLSPLTPYQFVVAGESPYGYLFDRRQIGRHLTTEWGVPPDHESMTTCVRRFGRTARGPGENQGFEHVTGAKMSHSNGHEVLLSYSADAVYLYSTRDEPTDPSELPSQSSVLQPNEKKTISATASGSATDIEERRPVHSDSDRLDDLMEEDIERILAENSPGDAAAAEGPISHNEDIDEDTNMEDAGDEDEDFYPDVPVILPRARFSGICNVETVKDVNFLGPHDEFVTSGSDDGNLFIWNKASGQLMDILEGDAQVVNVVEGHPYLPLIAVSGIDTTVKLFAPAHGDSAFSRMGNAGNIIERNADTSSRRLDLSRLMLYARIARQIGVNDEQCTSQ